MGWLAVTPSNITENQRPAAGEAHIPPPSTRSLSRSGLACILLIFVVGNGMLLGYLSTQREVQLLIDDQPFTARTHQTTVGALLDELGIPLTPEDIVMAPLDAALADTGPIVILRALPIDLQADGLVLQLRTHARTVADFLREADVSFGRHDRVTLEGKEVEPETLLPYSASLDEGGTDAAELWREPPLEMEIHRAVRITVHDGMVPIEVLTTNSTVGQALFDEGIVLYLGDGVTPSLGSQISAGTQIYIQRSTPLVILADGRRIKTRTRSDTVGQALEDEAIELVGKDYTTPDGETEVYDNMTVQVVRVQEQVVLEEEPIPFETVWQADPELELDKQRLDQGGAAGAKRRLVRIVYENGEETERVTEDEWVETQPTTEIIAYGTKIVIREVQTPEGPKTYWRKFRALATAYSASTAGTPPDAPWYGRTYMGLPARKGIIAVDRNVIPLGTWMYVPTYGVGLAGDLGVQGKHIDLCFDEGSLPRGYYRWLDIYLLTPVPPADKIRWILPSYPRER
jgi:uncharacterized protein YabE (DUF348 family)